MPARCRGAPRGAVLVAVLIVLVLVGLAAARAAEVWATVVRREAEQQLLFVGDQYRNAIRSYYFAAPRAQARVMPASLDMLLDDRRFLVPVQHLRRLYPDPITGSAEWGLVMQGNGIAGVHSLSQAAPLKQTGFDGAHAGFESRGSYREWAFVFVPPPLRRR